MTEYLYQPPLWANPNNPVWLDWFTRLIELTKNSVLSLSSISGNYVVQSAGVSAVYPASPTTIATLNVTTDGGTVIVLCGAYYQVNVSFSPRDAYFYLYSGDTEVQQCIISSPDDETPSAQNVMMFYAHTPEAGEYTYTVRCSTSSSVNDTASARLIGLVLA